MKKQRATQKTEKIPGRPAEMEKAKLVWRHTKRQRKKTKDSQENLIKRWAKVHILQPTQQDQQSKANETTIVSTNPSTHNARAATQEPYVMGKYKMPIQSLQ